MSDPVVVPLWLFVTIALLAVWAVFVSLLFPGARWFMRRRIRNMIRELNTRLQLKIEPFKMTKRQSLIDRLEYDTEIVKAAEAYAFDNKIPIEEAMALVGVYAREIVPSFNAYVYFSVAYRIAQWTVRVLFRVRLGSSDEDKLTRMSKNSSVVFVMNHRSNVDYILVAYLVATRSAISYAVGEWARVWPLQALIQSLGAFFIRRGSGNNLYRKVVARYVRMAIEGGVAQALYPEGWLSRDGKLQPPKMGLLGYMVNGFDKNSDRDLLFVPVGINYDRVFEDRSLVRRLDPDAARKSWFFSLRTTSKFIFKNFYLMALGRWYRFGYAGVNFGSPVSMREYSNRRGVDFKELKKEEFFKEVENLANELMEKIGEVIPVLPVSLVSTVFLTNEKNPMSELEVKAKTFELMKVLEESGAKVYIPRSDRDYAVTVGLRMLTLRDLVTEEEGMYHANPEERDLLSYYANSIAHLIR